MLAMLSTIVHCIVGCNTGAPDQQALHVLECDTETGAAKIVQSVKGLQGTTYFALDQKRQNLYTMITDRGPDRSATGQSHGALVKFALDPTCATTGSDDAAARRVIGKITRLCDLPCEAPCHISLTPDEKALAFASYVSATCGVFDLDTARLTTYVFPDDAMGPRADRQKKAYAHQTFYPAANTLGVVDLGCDRVRFFAQDARTPGPQDSRTLQVIGELKADPGDGPRHALLSADGNFLFVVNELSSSVTSYRRRRTGVSPVKIEERCNSILNGQDARSTEWTKVGKWSALPADCPLKPTETKAAAIKLTADGKILMASNRGHDSIAFFAVNEDGSLTLKNIAKLTGKFPRDFELMPGEKFMVVGHKMSNEIQVYAFDRAACTLTPVGAPIAAWRPLCFKFL